MSSAACRPQPITSRGQQKNWSNRSSGGHTRMRCSPSCRTPSINGSLIPHCGYMNLRSKILVAVEKIRTSLQQLDFLFSSHAVNTRASMSWSTSSSRWANGAAYWALCGSERSLVISRISRKSVGNPPSRGEFAHCGTSGIGLVERMPVSSLRISSERQAASAPSNSERIEE